jgi:hypothetical protein
MISLLANLTTSFFEKPVVVLSEGAVFLSGWEPASLNAS